MYTYRYFTNLKLFYCYCCEFIINMQQQQENSSQNSPFQGYTVKELRVLARSYKIKYYYKFRKVDLIDALTKFMPNLYHNLDTIFPFKLELFSIKNKTKKKYKNKKIRFR